MQGFHNHLDHYRGLSPIIWKGVIINLFESSLIAICYFLSLYFINELKLNIAYAGMIMSFYGVGTIFGGLIGGKLSDRIHPNLVSIGSLLLQAFAFLFLTQIRSLPFLISDLFFLGIASYGFITSNQVWVLSHCIKGKHQRLKTINILSVASNLGLGVASIIIGVFNTSHFIAIFYLLSGLLTCVAIYLMKLYFKEKIDNINPHQLNENLSEQTATPNKNNFKIILFTLACLFSAGLMVSQTNATYPIYLQQIFPVMGVKSFSFLFAINTFMVVLFQAPIANNFSDKNKISTVGLGVFILGLGFMLLNMAYCFPIAILACIIMTIGEIIFFSVSLSICYEYSAHHKKGQSVGNYRVVYASSRIAGPLLGGIIYHQFGGKILWYFCGILGLICLFVSKKLKAILA